MARTRWLLAVGTPGVALLAFAVQLPVLGREPAFGVVSALVTVGFFVTGVLLVAEPGHGRTALGLVAFAGLYAVGWLNAWERGPMPLLAEVMGPAALAFGGWALLRYPDAELRGWIARAFTAALFVWQSLPQALLALVSRPRWHGFATTAWWPTVWPAPTLYAVGHHVYEAGATCLAAGFVVLVAARAIGRGGLDRRVSMPVTMASAVGAAAVGAGGAGEFLGLSRPLMDGVFTAGGILLLLIPAGFIAMVLRRRLARAAVADLVLRVSGAATGRTVREALRTTLCDPALDVLCWIPEDGVYVDGEGAPADPAAVSSGRLPVPVAMSDGQPLAIVVADPALARHQGLLDAAAAACRMAMENARLHQARASRARVVEDSLAQLRQVERDLHDGAQQRLLALATRLAVARSTAGDTTTAATIDEARRDLRLALRELRDLAHGIQPAVLTQSGLGPALEEVAGRLPLPVDLRVPERRFTPTVETTIYFVICEALANVVKHAEARRAEVRVRPASGAVEVLVADDGVGGADAGGGTGLAGLADRVHALGGELALISPPGGGTRVLVRLPCG